MESTRELYKQKYEAQLEEWGAKIDELKAHADKLTAQAKLDLKPHTEAVHAKLEAAKAKLRHLSEATDDSWEGVKKDAEVVWHDARSAVEGAFDALTGHQKK